MHPVICRCGAILYTPDPPPGSRVTRCIYCDTEEPDR